MIDEKKLARMKEIVDTEGIGGGVMGADADDIFELIETTEALWRVARAAELKMERHKDCTNHHQCSTPELPEALAALKKP